MAKERVVIVNKVLDNGEIVGLTYRSAHSFGRLFVGKSDFQSFFKNYDVINARVTKDLKVYSTDHTYNIKSLSKEEFKVYEKKQKGIEEIRKTGNYPYTQYDAIKLEQKDSNFVTLYHGSLFIVENPDFNYENVDNDYGKGFYCTQCKGLAKEWASKTATVNRKGFLNEYRIDLSNMKILRLDSSPNIKNVLIWLCILTENRRVSLSNIQQNYLDELRGYCDVPDYNSYDIITGYRADDSYFTCVKDFLSLGCSLEKVSNAFKSGSLGNQVVLKSKKAFDAIKFVGKSRVPIKYKDDYFARDSFARNYFKYARDTGHTTIVDVVNSYRKGKRL